MPTKAWNKARMAALYTLVEMDATVSEIATAVGRSEISVLAKLAHLKHGDRMREAVLTGLVHPVPRKNDDPKHLTLVAQANGGFCFPALDLKATYRVAA